MATTTNLNNSGTQNYQTVGMLEAEDFYSTHILSSPDATFSQAKQPSTDLGEFLSRPIKLAAIDWQVGSEFNHTFKPWLLFFSHPSVKNKIANYAFLNCKLVVRFQINATPFHYGRALVSYEPWPQVPTTHIESASQTYVGFRTSLKPTDAGNNGTFMVSYSQRPSVNLDASTNQSGELRLPFFHNHNTIYVPGQSDFKCMGDINVNSYVPLLHAAGGTNNATIVMWVHAEEVELAGPTMSQPLILPQDEYEDAGPVSGPSAATAKIAAMLVDAPVIGPFAKATQLAASSVSSIARLFGFSRPAVITKSIFNRPRPFNSIAATDMPDTVEKLTLSSKAELTVDPRTVGLSDIDEMSLKYLLEKESYLTYFPWSTNDTHETCIFGMAVQPRLLAQAGNPPNAVYSPTTLSFVSSAFNYWSGTIKIRFSFVCSRYHRGRVRIVYDPVDREIVSNPDCYNTNFQKVVDLAAARDIEIEVPWCQPEPYREGIAATEAHATYQPNWINRTHDYTSLKVHWQNHQYLFNGYLAVYVVNELTSPDAAATDPVNVLVSVSAGEDFEVQAPTETEFTGHTYFGVGTVGTLSNGEDSCGPYSVDKTLIVPQDGEDVGEHDPRNIDENAPEATNSEPISTIVPNMADMKQQIFFGDVPTSLRQLMKRYAFTASHTLDYTSTDLSAYRNIWWRVRKHPFPYYPGVDPIGRHNNNTNNRATMNFITYFTPAYTGWRGALRKKMLIAGFTPNTVVTVGRTTAFPTSYISDVGHISEKFGDNQIIQNHRFQIETLSGLEGGSINTLDTNAGVEYEFPYYKRNRFSFARNFNIKNGLYSDNTQNEQEEVRVLWPEYTKYATTSMREYIAIGEDFSLFGFLNAPAFRLE